MAVAMTPLRCGHCGKPNGMPITNNGNSNGNDSSNDNDEKGAVIKLKLCTGCKRVYYCNSQCQKNARTKHKATCSPRMIRVKDEEHHCLPPSANDTITDTNNDNNTQSTQREIEQRENDQLLLLSRTMIEQKIRPSIMRDDVTQNLAHHLRSMLLGPALPLNKQHNFIQDILNDTDLCADAEIFIETLTGCDPGLIPRNRQDETKRVMYPDPKARLRVSPSILYNRCRAMVENFAMKKDVSNEDLQAAATEAFYDFYVTTILERRPPSYNSYTGLTAVVGDVKFLKRSEDIVLYGLGLLEELPKDGGTLAVLEKAPPPMHTLLLFGIILVICLGMLPSLEMIDEHATVETFTTSVFKQGPLFLSPFSLGVIRMVFAFICIIVTKAKINNGVKFLLTYLPDSKLQKGVVELNGWKTQGFYTSWAWNLLGTSFFLGGLIPLLVVYDRQDILTNNPWILRAALISFEIAAPSALLTSAVVTYALWPRAYNTHGPSGTVGFKNWINMFQHNANTAMVLMELCVLGGLPVKLSHGAFAPLFAMIYQTFLWSMTNRWSPKHGPVFLYFFMDTTLGVMTTVFMATLLVVILIFFVLFAMLDMAMISVEEGGHGVLPNLGCVFFISFLLMKFRD